MNFIVAFTQIVILIASMWGVFYSGMMYLETRPGAGIILLFSLVPMGLCIYWIKARGDRLKNRLDAQILAVAPDGFTPRVEVLCLDAQQYVGISPEMGRVVVIDKKRGIARCEPLDWIQRWDFHEPPKGFASLTFWFRDFAFPSMQLTVPQGAVDDTASKLRYALKF